MRIGDSDGVGWRALLAGLGGLLLVLCCVALWTLMRLDLPAFVLVHVLHALAYVGAVVLLLGGSGRQPPISTRAAPTPPMHHGVRWLSPIAIIIAVAVLMRIIAVAAPPTLTTDAYRYVWDGRVQAAGINPYLYVPASPELRHLRDTAIYPNINRAETHPTIYPPVAEALFLAGVRIYDGIRGQQILMLLLDLVTVWAITRWLVASGMPRERVLIYAWHPLPVWEFAGMAHIDGAAVMLMCLALLAAETGRQGLAGAALAASGLAKYYLVLLAPALWRRWGWKLPAAMIATVLVCYLPYAAAGPKLLGSLFVHLDEEGYNNGFGFYLTGVLKHFGLPHPSSSVFTVMVALSLLGLGAAIALRRRPETIEPTHLIALAAAFLVLISPHYPWYYTLAIPLLCRKLYVPLLWVTLLVSSIYLEAQGGILEPYTRIKVFSLMFGGFAVLAVWVWWRGRRQLT